MAATQQGTNYYGFGLAQRPKLSGRRWANNEGHVKRWLPMAEEALKTPFKGVTTDGTVVPGLFPIRRTGHSTRAMVEAVKTVLGTLDAEQRETVTFPID